MMKKLWNWVRRDGLLHIETCALIALVIGLFTWWWLGGIVSAAVGYGKEIWDKKHGVYDTHDLVCDGIGVVLGTAITLITILL